MNPSQLAKQCVDSMNAMKEIGFAMKDAHISIVTPKGWKAPPKFPRGTILQVKDDGRRVRSLPAMNVLAWMAANGLVNVDVA